MFGTYLEYDLFNEVVRIWEHTIFLYFANVRISTEY
jgi:hypothetical protein